MSISATTVCIGRNIVKASVIQYDGRKTIKDE